MRFVNYIDIKNLFDLGLSCFEGFLKNISHIVSETQRFNMVEKWIQINDSSEHTKSLLRVVDFNKMTVEEFYNGPGQSKLLSDRDKYKIISKLASNMRNPDNEDTVEQELNSKKRKIAIYCSSSIPIWHEAEVYIMCVLCGSYFKFISHFQFLREKMFFAFTNTTIHFGKTFPNIIIAIAMLRNMVMSIE